MYRTILEEISESKLGTPQWEYVDADKVLENVKVIRPRWRWMVRVCAEMPQGKCVLFPVPEDEDCNIFARCLRTSISLGTSHKFSIRVSRDEKYVVVLKGEAWRDYYRRMEEVSQ